MRDKLVIIGAGGHGRVCAEIAELCGISEGHMRRLFAEKLGRSPIGYKNALAAQAACTLLRPDGMNVSEVATSLGYPDIYTFSQAFKKEIGVSPKKYANLSVS